MVDQRGVARAYAFAHSYRKFQDRAPLSESRPPIRFKRLMNTERIALLPADRTLLAHCDIAQVFQTIASASTAQQPPAAFFSLLSTLLYFNMGVFQIDFSHSVTTDILHRPFPSPGSLYPSDLYVYVPGASELPEGLYHYHGFHHDLSLVRQERVRELLQEALGSDLGTPEMVLIVGSNLWRVVRKYADFGYRLACLEAGHLVANILTVAAALGMVGIVHYLFDDDLLEQCLGLPSLEDATMAVIPLYRPAQLPALPLPPHNLVHKNAQIEPIKGHWHISSGMHLPEAVRVKELERAIRTWNDPRPLPEDGEIFAFPAHGPSISLAPPAAPECDLLTAYQQRNSGLHGKYGMAITTLPVPQSSLAFILQYALNPYAHDLNWGHPAPPRYIRLIAMANCVQGVQVGGYLFKPEDSSLSQLTAAHQPARTFGYQEMVNGRAMSIIWNLSIDYDRAIREMGDRAYRIVNMEAGLIAQNICLLSAAQQLFVRPFCAFDEQALDSWLGLESAPEQIAYTLLSGYNRAVPLRFGIRP